MKNWKTSLSGIVAAFFALLAALAALNPVQLGPLYDVIPQEWKPIILKISGAAALIMFVVGKLAAADANPTPLPSANKIVGAVVVGLFLLGGAVFLTGCGTDGHMHASLPVPIPPKFGTLAVAVDYTPPPSLYALADSPQLEAFKSYVRPVQ